MNPTQPTQSNEAIAKSNKKKLIWGLICIIGPTALLIVSILLYAVINFFVAQSGSPTIDEITGETARSTGQIIANVTLYLIGAATVVTWLPGIIGGIILLATRKPLQ